MGGRENTQTKNPHQTPQKAGHGSVSAKTNTLLTNPSARICGAKHCCLTQLGSCGYVPLELVLLHYFHHEITEQWSTICLGLLDLLPGKKFQKIYLQENLAFIYVEHDKVSGYYSELCPG